MTLYIKNVIQPPRAEAFFNICDANVKNYWFDKEYQPFDNIDDESKSLILNASQLSIDYINLKGSTEYNANYLYNLIPRMAESFYMFYNPNARPPGVSVEVEPLNEAGTKTMARGLPTRQLEDLPHTECNKFMYVCVITDGYRQLRADPNNIKWCDDDNLIEAIGAAAILIVNNFDNLDDDDWLMRFTLTVYFNFIAFISNELDILNPGNTFLANYNTLIPDEMYENIDNTGEIK